MDIYYAMTNYHVLCCILHRMISDKKNKAKLWVSSYLVDDQPSIIKDLKKSMIFDDVTIFKEVRFIYYDKKNYTESMIEEELDNICKGVEDYSREIMNSLNLYVCQDTYGLGIYLNRAGIDYNYFEDGCGRLSSPEIEMALIEDGHPMRARLVKKLKCLGKSANVKERYGDLSEQKEGYFNSKDVDFSVKKILKRLTRDELDKILKIYHCRKYNLKKKKKDLLLTWHYNNMNFMSLEEQKLFFTLLVDYFKMEDEMLFIKPHPSDRQPDYQEYFEDAVVLERHMPAELLPFLIDDKFEKGITNWSTSIFGLQDILKEIINFDKDIDKTYKDFNKYFAIVKYLDSVKIDGRIQNLHLIEINEKQLLQLMKYYFEDYKRYYKISDAKSSIYIVHKYDSKYKNKKYLAIEKDKDCAFENLLSIKFGEKRECVYLYNLPFSEIQVKKVMKYSGCELEVNFVSLNQYIDSLNQEIVTKNKEIGMLKEEEKKKVEDLNAVVDDYKGKLETVKKELNDIINSSSWKITKPLRKLNSVRVKNERRKD